MANLWREPGVPHKGWHCIDVIDVREDGSSPEEAEYETCQMCGNERIRFVHIVEHDEYDETLGVGCICAEKLTEDYINPRLLEKELRNKASRKARWLTREWRVSRQGNHYLAVDGFNVGIFPDRYKPGKWKYRISYQSNSYFSKSSYSSPREAKLALFEAYWQMVND